MTRIETDGQPMRLYAPDDYGRHGCLKPSALLIVTLLYAIRHLLIVFLAYNPSPRLGGAFAFLQPLAEPWFVAADLPALLVLLAWWQRRPEAKALWRGIWRYGRVLLTISLLAQTALLAHAQGMNILESYYLSQGERLAIVSLGLNLLLIYYLWRFPRVRDTFADFPAVPAASG